MLDSEPQGPLDSKRIVIVNRTIRHIQTSKIIFTPMPFGSAFRGPREYTPNKGSAMSFSTKNSDHLDLMSPNQPFYGPSWDSAYVEPECTEPTNAQVPGVHTWVEDNSGWEPSAHESENAFDSTLLASVGLSPRDDIWRHWESYNLSTLASPDDLALHAGFYKDFYGTAAHPNPNQLALNTDGDSFPLALPHHSTQYSSSEDTVDLLQDGTGTFPEATRINMANAFATGKIGKERERHWLSDALLESLWSDNNEQPSSPSDSAPSSVHAGCAVSLTENATQKDSPTRKLESEFETLNKKATPLISRTEWQDAQRRTTAADLDLPSTIDLERFLDSTAHQLLAPTAPKRKRRRPESRTTRVGCKDQDRPNGRYATHILLATLILDTISLKLTVPREPIGLGGQGH
ncbi:hypothetical protein BJX62DRAFT_144362 [Aspergillus germanicus]